MSTEMIPALYSKSEHYPQRFKGKVPKLVRILKTVKPDFPFNIHAGENAIEGKIYPVWTNCHGAVAAYLDNDRKLGLKPDEFEVVDWYP